MRVAMAWLSSTLGLALLAISLHAGTLVYSDQASAVFYFNIDPILGCGQY